MAAVMVRRTYAKSAIRAMQDYAYVPAVLPLELVPSDRILQRWSVAIGAGLPSEDWDDRPVSRVTPLDDGTAVVVDQIVMHAPPKTRKFIKLWYKTPLPVPQIAERMRLEPKRAYQALGVILYYMKWKFQESKYPDLLKILETRL